MAKKSRTPPPPRRPVQAPKKRGDTRKPDADRRRLALLVGFAALGLVGLAAALAAFAFGGGGNSSANAGPHGLCVQKNFPSQGRKHVLALPKGFKYNSFPPTSGPHNPAPAIWDQYDQPLEQIVLVHNLEHGGIVIQYGNKVPSSSVDKITAFYRSDPNALVVAPLPQLGTRIALTAWTHLDMCSGFDANEVKRFRDAYRYKAPEHYPKQFLDPGQ